MVSMRVICKYTHFCTSIIFQIVFHFSQHCFIPIRAALLKSSVHPSRLRLMPLKIALIGYLSILRLDQKLRMVHMRCLYEEPPSLSQHRYLTPKHRYLTLHHRVLLLTELLKLDTLTIRFPQKLILFSSLRIRMECDSAVLFLFRNVAIVLKSYLLLSLTLKN